MCGPIEVTEPLGSPSPRGLLLWNEDGAAHTTMEVFCFSQNVYTSMAGESNACQQSLGISYLYVTLNLADETAY